MHYNQQAHGGIKERIRRFIKKTDWAWVVYLSLFTAVYIAYVYYNEL